MIVKKKFECPTCNSDIEIDVEVYSDAGDLCWNAPDTVQCILCGRESDVYVGVEINVEAYDNGDEEDLG